MLLAIQQSEILFAKHGVIAREICDKCGIVLGGVRFTRYGESEVYCSRECRGDAHITGGELNAFGGKSFLAANVHVRLAPIR